LQNATETRRFKLDFEKDADDPEPLDWRAALAKDKVAQIAMGGFVEIRGAEPGGKVVGTIAAPATRVTWTPSGDALATALDDGAIRLWPAAPPTPFHGVYGVGLPFVTIPSPVPSDTPHALDVHPSGKLLASATGGGALHLFDLPGGTPRLTAHTVKDTTAAVAFTPAGYFEAIGNEARQEVLCFVGARRVATELCAESFEVHGLIAKVIAGDRSYEEP
jgi:WD40 repeat protein